MEHNYPYTKFYTEDKEEIDETIGGFNAFPHTDFTQVDDGEIYALSDGVSELVKAVTNPTSEATATTGEPDVETTIKDGHLHFDFKLPSSSDEVMKYYIVTYDGTHFKHDDTVETFLSLKERCLNTTDFVYCQYANRLYIPQYVSNNNIFFEASYIQNDIPQMHRLSINDQNVTSQNNYTITKATQLNATNARVEALEGEMVGVKTDIDSISEAIDEINVDITDLSDTVNTIDTRVATETQLGQVKTSMAYQLNNDDGLLKAISLSSEAYESANDNSFVSKGTLETRLERIDPETSINAEILWNGSVSSGNTGDVAIKNYKFFAIEFVISSSGNRVVCWFALPMINSVTKQSRTYIASSEAYYLTWYVTINADNTAIKVHRTGGSSSTQVISTVIGVM